MKKIQGNDVICVDIDKNKVDKLNSGQVTIFEPGLEKLFLRNQKEGRLHFTTALAEAIKDAKVIILALPTPPGEDGSADLKYILGVADDLGKIISEYKVIVDKSTVPVGTAEKVHAAILKNAKVPFDVVSNPEFLREGVAVDDFMKPDRVVIGTTSDKAKKFMNDLYAPFVRQGNPIIFMDEKSAELTKYAANSFLATKITFMNEIAQLCERLNADVDMVRRGIGSDERMGRRRACSAWTASRDRCAQSGYGCGNRARTNTRQTDCARVRSIPALLREERPHQDDRRYDRVVTTAHHQ